MAILVSPGIAVSEFDTTGVVPAVSTSVGALAGVFRWGPAYQITLVDQEQTVVNMFGKPDDNTFETFFTAANFLAYGNALNIVRTIDAAAKNSLANTANAAAIQISNSDSFANLIIDANVAYYARYAGALGNSLKISVCDSPVAYTSNVVPFNAGNSTSNATGSAIQFVVGSNTVVINSIATAQNGIAIGAANTVLNALIVGDYLKVGNSTTGYQYLQVTAKGTPSAEASIGNGQYQSTANISLGSAYNGSANINMTTCARYWEFFNTVDKAPGTSTYMSTLSLNTQDEMHVIIVDQDGFFTGTPNKILEKFIGMSRASDAKAQNGQTNYYKNVLNLTSQFVYAGTPRAGAGIANSSALANSSTTTPLSLSFVSGVDSSSEGSVSLGTVATGYDLFTNKENVDISLLMQGKAINVGGLANYIIGNIAATRLDLVAFVSPDAGIVTSQDKAQYCVDFRAATNGVSGITYNSSYAFMDGNYKYQYDKYNDTYRWVPFNGDMAGLCAATDFSRDAWWSPAGFNRGQIKNVTKLAFNPTQAQRDLLYKNDVNPIVNFPAAGTVLYGDKTMIGKAGAFDRINVRRLFIVLEKAISIAARSSLFEFNNSFTRAQFKNMVDSYLGQIQGRQGIYDFKVVCDTTNNTGQVIDSNQFVGDIYVKPAKSINYIQLNFIAVGTSVDFNIVVGNF